MTDDVRMALMEAHATLRAVLEASARNPKPHSHWRAKIVGEDVIEAHLEMLRVAREFK